MGPQPPRTGPSPAPADAGDPAAALLRWFDRHRRPLPWRESPDPYRVWVSEVMLQQTRVETVLPYYGRFLERFPTVEALASGRLDEVLALWSGLGYYRRARAMHRAARRIVEAGHGFPRSARELRELPGVGRYTAAAVASIAFGEPVAAMDGNVLRVTARLTAEAEDPRRAAAGRRLEAAAAALLDPRRPGDSNQALMELGARICRPSHPDCGRCPLSAGCRAAAEGDPEVYPPPRRRRRVRRERLLALVVRDGGRLLLFRRPDDSTLLAGTWELPWTRAASGSAAAEDLARRYGGVWRLGRRRGSVRHGITHRALQVEVRSASFSAAGEARDGTEAAWVDPGKLDELPLSSLVRKALACAPRPGG